MTFKRGFKGLWGKAAIMLSAIIILVLAVSTIGCAPKETPTTPTTPTHEVLKLKLGTYIPVNYDPYVYPGQKLFVDEVNKRGAGIVQIDPYWGGTLLDAASMIPGLQDGTADLVFHTGAYMLGTYPIVGIEIVPIWKDIVHTQDMNIGTPLYELKNKVLAQKNLFEIAFGGGVPEFIFLRDKEVHKVADLKGVRIRVSGNIPGQVAKALGATPTTIPSAELPQALQQGTVDGAIMNPWTSMGRGVEDYCEYCFMAGVDWQTTPLFTMLDRWNSWPKDVQDVIMDVAKWWEPHYCGTKEGGALLYPETLQEQLMPYYKSKGVTMIEPTPDELKEFMQTCTPVVDWWVSQVGEDVGRQALKLAGWQ